MAKRSGTRLYAPPMFAAFGLLIAGCGNDNDLKRHNEAPTATITAPADGEVFRQGSGLVLLAGVADDSYDPPEDLTVTWTAGDADVPVTTDADGIVTGELSIDSLPLGPLHMVLTVTDTDGEGATDEIDIVIEGPLGAPTVHISTPDDGSVYTVGSAIAFRGEATDITTPADDLLFDWSSSLDGAMVGAVSSDGVSAVFVEGLSAGEHAITLTATDTDGELGSDTITVVIEEEEVIAEPGDLVFSEMMVNPEAVDDVLGEWVELYNTSGSTIDVTGYTFRDDDVDGWVLEGPLLVAAHDYVVLCATVEIETNGGVPCDGWFYRDSTGGGLALANGEDELVLARPDGVEIDWLHYDETWYTVGVALGLGADWFDGGANDDASHWCDQTTITAPMTEPGTPGTVNDSCDGF